MINLQLMEPNRFFWLVTQRLWLSRKTKQKSWISNDKLITFQADAVLKPFSASLDLFKRSYHKRGRFSFDGLSILDKSFRPMS